MGKFTGLWISEELIQMKLSPSKTMVLSMIRELQPFHGSNKYIAEKLNLTSRSVSSIITELQTKKLINISGKTSARIITIEDSSLDNYRRNFHSTIEETSQTCEETSVTIEETSTNNKDIIDNKEYNKVTHLEKVEYRELATLLMTLHQVEDSKYKKSDSQLNKWASDIRKLSEIDKRNLKEIEEIIRWVKRPGEFWFSNIMSGKKLREKADTLISQMKRDNYKSVPKDEQKNKNYAEGW